MNAHAEQAIATAFAFSPEFFLSQSVGHLTTVAMRADQLWDAQDALIELGTPHDDDEAHQAQVLGQLLGAAQRALGGQPLSALSPQVSIPITLDGAVFQTVDHLRHPELTQVAGVA